VADNYVRDKVIAVTGAGSGFGRLVCEKTGALGAKVVCADINASTLDGVVAGLKAKGIDVLGRVTDVTHAEDVRALADAAVQRFSRIDVMINNAGVMPLGFYADHDKALTAWTRCIDINIKGVLFGGRRMAGSYRRSPCGRVHSVGAFNERAAGSVREVCVCLEAWPGSRLPRPDSDRRGDAGKQSTAGPGRR